MTSCEEKITLTRRLLRCVPNTLTLCNSLCGFAAILWTLTAYESPKEGFDIFTGSALIILGAMIFDVLDGFAARLLNAQSMCGLQMDSLADMVTFGVAPATLMAIMTHHLQIDQHGAQTMHQMVMTYVLCSVYLGCAALRLATYNVRALSPDHGDGSIFHGLPSPGAAAAISSLVLAARIYPDPDKLKWLNSVLPVYAAILGLLMVSPLPYLHAGRYLTSIRLRNHWKIVSVLVMIVFIVILRETAVFLLISLYVLSGPAIALYRLIRYGRLTPEVPQICNHE